MAHGAAARAGFGEVMVDRVSVRQKRGLAEASQRDSLPPRMESGVQRIVYSIGLSTATGHLGDGPIGLPSTGCGPGAA
jgi:hypothetical protein